jgi:diguanylate cyclase (GGDEF)-like protein
VLRAVASRLRAVLRPSDVVARVGGDEFVAVCEELDGKGEGEAIAARVDTVIRQTIKSSAGELRTSASVGLALAEGTADVTADDLIRLADEAMYRAKQAGAGIST